MRASELLGTPVHDAADRCVGEVADVVLRGDEGARPPGAAYPVVGLVVGPQPWAHRWGLASGRVRRPALLRRLAGPARRSVFVAAGHVVTWRTDAIRLRVAADALPSAEEERS